MANSTSHPKKVKMVTEVCNSADLASQVLRDLDSPVARDVRRALREGRHKDVIDASIDPSSYSCPDALWRDWLAVNLLSKFPKFELGIDTAEVAFTKFKMAEEQCAHTNKRLSGSYDTPTTGVSGESLIWAARRKIADLLGAFSWDEAEPHMSFSSGASTRLPRRKGDAYYKLQGVPEVTRNCAILALVCIERSPQWAKRMREQYGLNPELWVKIVPGNRITTVAKNAKTDRVIAIEPCMNMYVQKGIGGVIKARLKRVGINLEDQSINQELARLGSIDGSLATIDLSSASDTVAMALCEALLPPDWWEAMLLCRSPIGVFPDGSVVRYQKVSSMGNGFTFELESLIFWALSAAVVDLLRGSDRRLAVYGDDIIVPNAAAGWLIELLEYCGFKTNVEKSFTCGPFRESCGKHYFRGIDVTPFYIRHPINDECRRLWFCNSLRRWASRPTPGYADGRVRRSHKYAVALLKPSNRKPVIPDGVGDGGLIGTFTEALPSREDGLWRCRVIAEGKGISKAVHDCFVVYRDLLRRAAMRDGVEPSTWEQPRLVRDYPWVLKELALQSRSQRENVAGENVLFNPEKVWRRTSKLLLPQWADAPVWC